MKRETDAEELERIKGAMATKDEPAIVDGIKIRQQRIAAGKKAYEQFFEEMPQGEVTLPAEIANELRAVLFHSVNWSKYRGVMVADDKVPFEDTPAVATSIQFERDLIERLCAAMGMQRIRMDNHGSCEGCKFGPRPRGWSEPCVGCGYGLPCFIPKEEEAQAA